MTNVVPDTSTWNIVLRRVTDPSEQKKLGAKSFGVVAVILIVTVVGFVIGFSGLSFSGFILGGIGALAILIWTLIAVNSVTTSKWTGDDRIEIVVADEGVIVQGGLAVTWDEIVDIEYEWSNPKVAKGNLATVAGGTAALAAFNAAGIDTVVKAFKIRLKDYKPIKARAQSKIQRLVIFEAMLGSPGYLHVGQGGRSPEAMQELLTVLAAQAERHGVPLNRVS
jgi:hypothetical protein